MYKRQHLLGVGDGLVEGLGEVVGDEDGEVGVLALFLLEAVAIDHGQVCLLYTSFHTCFTGETIDFHN